MECCQYWKMPGPARVINQSCQLLVDILSSLAIASLAHFVRIFAYLIMGGT